jgi:hypothetical protein
MARQDSNWSGSVDILSCASLSSGEARPGIWDCKSKQQVPRASSPPAPDGSE